MSGFGIYIFSNGEKFVGNLKNGEKNGEGSYYYLNGNVYEGNWANDKKNGFGKYYYFAMDEKYEGEFKNNLKHG